MSNGVTAAIPSGAVVEQALKAGLATAKEQHRVKREAPVAKSLAEKVESLANEVGHRARRLCHGRRDLMPEAGRHLLVGVNQEDPVGVEAEVIEGPLPLLRIARGAWKLHHFRSSGQHQGRGFIRAA